MLRAALMFFILALVAMAIGATGIAGLSIEIGRTLIGVFLVLAIVSALVHLLTGRSSRLFHDDG